MRRLSPYLTRLLLPTPITADAVTGVALTAGLGAALLLSLPGVLPATGAVVLVQLQMLLDCSDGEIARWRRQFSAAGIYLDRIGHYVTACGRTVAGTRPEDGRRSGS
jgi:phosphatidylglycerophosphate synthase